MTVVDSAKLTLRDRQKLGVTLSNLLRKARKLRNEGVDITAKSLLEAVIDDLSPANDLQVTTINWEAILKFIEELLPIILKLLTLFA